MREAPLPILLVNGLWGTTQELEPLRAFLAERTGRLVQTLAFSPANGSAPIAALGAQVSAACQDILRTQRCARLDLVGFSMGALASRYFVQRGEGKTFVRKFVSISGPHAGSLNAHLLPLAGARDMRPGSTLLKDLASDSDPFGPVEVHVMYTPFDVVVVPARSALLPQAKSVTKIPTLLHRFMIKDARALAHVATLLGPAPATGA
jgi:triacylglycerol lipase